MGEHTGVFKDVPEVPNKAERRMVNVPSSVDLGEATVGVEQFLTVFDPTVRGGVFAPGIAKLRLDRPAVAPTPKREGWDKATAPPDPATTYELNPASDSIDLSPSQRERLELKLLPQTTGKRAATLHVDAAWEDGVQESYSVEVQVNVRGAFDTPRGHENYNKLEPAVAVTVGKGDGEGEYTADADAAALDAVSKAKTTAADANRLFVQSRRDGLNKIAEPQIAAYKKVVADQSRWEKFAELAITMVVSGLIGGFGKQLAASLASRVAGAVVDKGNVWISFFVDSAKEGLKAAAKAAVGAAFAPPTSSSVDVPGQLSAQQTINFFAHQAQLLTNVEFEQKQMIEKSADVLSHRHANDPFAASKSIDSLADTFRDMSGAAMTMQAHQTELQWVDGIARAQLDGSVEGAGTVSMVQKTGNRNKYAADVNGLLEISVTTDSSLKGNHDLETGNAKVTDARLLGVSQLVADDVANVDLAFAPIPIDFLVSGPSGEATRLRRDEAGRVAAVVGNAAEGAQFGRRIEEQLVARILARTLRDWGVTHPETDSEDKK